MSERLAFFVRGLPAPQGSKRALRNRHTGRVALVESSKHVAPWRSDVRDAALASMGDQAPYGGAVEVELVFALPRPKAHHVGGDPARGLRPGAPPVPTGKPDVDKLARAVLDALTGIVWADDAQVAGLAAYKRYAVELTGAEVTVWLP